MVSTPDRVLRVMNVSTGRYGRETPSGVFPILGTACKCDAIDGSVLYNCVFFISTSYVHFDAAPIDPLLREIPLHRVQASWEPGSMTGQAKLIVPRVILGAIMTASGVNWALNLYAWESSLSEEGLEFVRYLEETGWVWPLLKITELILGILLLSGYLGPFVVIALVPITLGILAFHILLSPTQGAWLGYIAFALQVVLISAWRKNLIQIFRKPEEGIYPQT